MRSMQQQNRKTKLHWNFLEHAWNVFWNFLETQLLRLAWEKGSMQGAVLKRVLPRGGWHFSLENLLHIPHFLVYVCGSFLHIHSSSPEVALAMVVSCMWCTACMLWGPAMCDLSLNLNRMGSSFPSTSMCLVPYNDLAVWLARQGLVTLIACISDNAKSPTPLGSGTVLISIRFPKLLFWPPAGSP